MQTCSDARWPHKACQISTTCGKHWTMTLCNPGHWQGAQKAHATLLQSLMVPDNLQLRQAQGDDWAHHPSQTPGMQLAGRLLCCPAQRGQSWPRCPWQAAALAQHGDPASSRTTHHTFSRYPAPHTARPAQAPQAVPCHGAWLYWSETW